MTTSSGDLTFPAPLVAQDSAARDESPLVPPRVAEALRLVLGGSDPSRWTVHSLADGGQARVFTARSTDAQQLASAKGDAEELVIKVYHGTGPDDRAAARDEYDCLRRLHARLD